MTDKFTDDDLWKELDEYFNIEHKGPGDFTLKEIAEHYRISEETARVKMKDLAKRGVYKYVKVIMDGRLTGVYRKAVQDA